MSVAAPRSSANRTDEMELVSFYVGDLLVGVDIGHVEEINRHLDLTPIPHAPASVRGVVNLRGDVVTVLDLRTILGLEKVEISKHTRNVVVASGGERIGLLVDRISDVVRAWPDDIDPSPANVRGGEGRFFKGIYQLEKELLVILDVDAVVNADCGGSNPRSTV